MTNTTTANTTTANTASADLARWQARLWYAAATDAAAAAYAAANPERGRALFVWEVVARASPSTAKMWRASIDALRNLHPGDPDRYSIHEL